MRTTTRIWSVLGYWIDHKSNKHVPVNFIVTTELGQNPIDIIHYQYNLNPGDYAFGTIVPLENSIAIHVPVHASPLVKNKSKHDYAEIRVVCIGGIAETHSMICSCGECRNGVSCVCSIIKMDNPGKIIFASRAGSPQEARAKAIEKAKEIGYTLA